VDEGRRGGVERGGATVVKCSYSRTRAELRTFSHYWDSLHVILLSLHKYIAYLGEHFIKVWSFNNAGFVCFLATDGVTSAPYCDNYVTQ
jgi:hypothetical protein